MPDIHATYNGDRVDGNYRLPQGQKDSISSIKQSTGKLNLDLGSAVNQMVSAIGELEKGDATIARVLAQRGIYGLDLKYKDAQLTAVHNVNGNLLRICVSPSFKGGD